MKLTTLVSLCFIEIFSTRCNCKSNKTTSMVYARQNQVYSSDIGEFANSKKLAEFESYVTGLAAYNDSIYVSTKRTGSFSRDSAIWRIKNSSNLSVEKLYELDKFFEDIVSMVIAEGYIYAGRTDGVIWRCTTNEPHSCGDFKELSLLDKSPEISDIAYYPADGRIYTVSSVYLRPAFSANYWYHRLMHCPSDSSSWSQPCIKESLGFKGWATLHYAFDAIWFGNAGLIQKCTFSHTRRLFDNCVKFHNFRSNGHVKVVASDKDLYVKLEHDRKIRRCNPELRNSCVGATEKFDADGIGPFIFV